MGEIVVGADGSEGGRRALAWAVEEARLRKSSVAAVCVIDRRYMDPDLGVLVAPANKELEEEAQRSLDAALEAVGGAEGVEVRSEVLHAQRHGVAGTLLERAEEGADMVVVGSRGHGGFTGLLLGSVSQQVIQHAPCPVVVVPGAKG